MTKAHLYDKLADGVAALEAVDLIIEETDLSEMKVRNGGEPESLEEAILGRHQEPETKDVLVFVASIGESDGAEVPDDPRDDEQFQDIEVEGPKSPAEHADEADFESSGQETTPQA